MDKTLSLNKYNNDLNIKITSKDYKVLDVAYNNKTTSHNKINAVTGRSEVHLKTDTTTTITAGEQDGHQRVINLQGEVHAIKGNTITVISVSGDCISSNSPVDLYVYNKNSKHFAKLIQINDFKHLIKINKGFDFDNVEGGFGTWFLFIALILAWGIGLALILFCMWCGTGKQLKIAEIIFNSIEQDLSSGKL